LDGRYASIQRGGGANLIFFRLKKNKHGKVLYLL